MRSQASPPARFNWSDVFPGSIIFRSLSPAFSISVMVFALIGVVATPMGWIVSESLFIGSEEHLNANPILAEMAEINRSPYRGVFAASENDQNKLSVFGAKLSGPRLVFEQAVKPFYAIFGGATTAREFLYYALGSLWSLVVWSFVGLGIARVSLLRLTRNEHAGLDDAFDYAIDYFPTSISALAIPLGLAFLLCIPTFLIGLLMGFDFGALLVGIGWIFVLGFAMLLGVLLLGLMVSWPLVVCSVAAEGQNSFDAITRAFAYVFQRPVHYFFYALVAVIFGGVVWLIAFQFTESVVRLSFWSTSWGANRMEADRMDTIKGLPSVYSQSLTAGHVAVSRFQDPSQIDPTQENNRQPISTDQLETPSRNSTTSDLPQNIHNSRASSVETIDDAQVKPESSNLKNARRFITFWTGFAKTIAAAFIHGLFWCMASAIYLLLRKDVDETELDEIFMIDERRTYDLPPLESDEHGIPQIQPLPLDKMTEDDSAD